VLEAGADVVAQPPDDPVADFADRPDVDRSLDGGGSL
jgi:hypothetical protein